MRLLSLIIALLLTVSGLYLAMAGGHSALDYFSALGDSQQRAISGGMVIFAILMLCLGGILKRRRAGDAGQAE
ncbi:MAG: hypothetical protein AB1807_16315 [Pseudomonadota bacterium]